MLSKSKSNRAKLAKYLLVLPLVLGMLFYSSCEQENDLTETEQFENLTDEQLLEKFISEIKDDRTNEMNIVELSEKYFKINQYNYLITRKEYYKQIAFFINMLSGKISDKSSKWQDKLANESYPEYLEEKKTEEAINRFENNINKGVLRKVVNDLDNITNKEQQLINSMLQQVETDDDYSGLAVTDGFNYKLYGEPKANSSESIYKSDAKEIPFSVADTAPKFPNCQDLSGEDLKKCFSQDISQLVAKNFNTNLAEKLNLKGEVRIIAIFKINEHGDLFDVRVRAPKPELEAETKRVLNLIPNLIPAKHEGENIVIAYSLPIKFKIK